MKTMTDDEELKAFMHQHAKDGYVSQDRYFSKLCRVTVENNVLQFKSKP